MSNTRATRHGISSGNLSGFNADGSGNSASDFVGPREPTRQNLTDLVARGQAIHTARMAIRQERTNVSDDLFAVHTQGESLAMRQHSINELNNMELNLGRERGRIMKEYLAVQKQLAIIQRRMEKETVKESKTPLLNQDVQDVIADFL